ncbi:MAG: hypothetical protein KAK00_00455 [Nanoarchaeota archaeon]|nr:hypothetical protein [Nanoarchaeota archaeon]
MHESELIAYDWLKKKGIIVKKNRSSPDFIGEKETYEVKRLYGNKLIFYETQRENIEKHKPLILVVSKGKVISSFRYGTKLPQEFEIIWVDYKKYGKLVRLNDDVEAWLNKINKNTNKALDTVKSNFITNKELSKLIEDSTDNILTEIRDLKS